MKPLLTLILLLLAIAAQAHRDDYLIETQADLREWCERESQAAFIGRGANPFNWTASTWEETNLLRVKGSWRIDNKESIVECRVARGAPARYAVMTIAAPK